MSLKGRESSGRHSPLSHPGQLRRLLLLFFCGLPAPPPGLKREEKKEGRLPSSTLFLFSSSLLPVVMLRIVVTNRPSSLSPSFFLCSIALLVWYLPPASRPAAPLSPPPTQQVHYSLASKNSIHHFSFQAFKNAAIFSLLLSLRFFLLPPSPSSKKGKKGSWLQAEENQQEWFSLEGKKKRERPR